MKRKPNLLKSVRKLKVRLLSIMIISVVLLNINYNVIYAFSSYTSGQWSIAPVKIVLSNGSDTISGHKSTVYSVSGAAPVVTNATAPLIITADGTTTVGLTTTDNAGNTSTRSYIIKIDMTAPTAGSLTMKLDSSTGATYTSNTWTYHNVYVALAGGSDATSGYNTATYSLTGATTLADQTAPTTVTAEGVTYVLVTTTDNAGNVAKTNYAIKIDKTLPTAGTLLMQELASTFDGRWDGEVNTPNLANTGLIPVTISGGSSSTTSVVTDLSSYWYDYNTTSNSSRWANAVTKDSSGNITGYFVWIPRFAYKINSGCKTSTAGSISIKFLRGTTDEDSSGNIVSENYPTVSSGAMGDYVVHPAFTNNVANGGWDGNIPGFWIAKYPAGFQASTIDANGVLQNASDTVVRSNINYSGIDNGYTCNAVDSSLSTSTKMSYPVFKPLTYAYNCIRVSDSYNLSKDIQNATSFYGLSNTDSHMEKNSEWGAVAYLTQSSYGKNGTEVFINNYNMDNSNSKNTYAVTGLYGSSASAASTTSISSTVPYSGSGMLGSSTGNIYGVYDLNGCIWERQASYIRNVNSSGGSFAYITDDTSPQTNGISSKWATTYPYDGALSPVNNWNLCSIFGDAIFEVSTSGTGAAGWNSDYSYYPSADTPFFIRGGACTNGSNAGIFASGVTGGICDNLSGFRVVLIPTEKVAPSAPVIANSSNGNWTNHNVALTVTSLDTGTGIAKYEYSYNQSTWYTSWEFPLSGNSQIGYWSAQRNSTVYIRATDSAGNVSPVSSTTVKIDKTAPPAPTISNSSNGNLTNQTVTITVTSADTGGSGIAKFEYSYDQITWLHDWDLALSGNSQTGYWSENRDSTVYFRAIDGAGNISALSTTMVRISK